MTPAQFTEAWLKAEPKLQKKARKISYEPEDLVQTVAANLWRSRDTFREGTDFTAWAYSSMLMAEFSKNNKTRRRYASPHFGLELAYNLPATPPVSDFIDPGIEHAMNRLEIHDRIALMLHDYVGLSRAETAAETGQTVGQIGGRVAKARRLMRLYLGPQFPSSRRLQ